MQPFLTFNILLLLSDDCTLNVASGKQMQSFKLRYIFKINFMSYYDDKSEVAVLETTLHFIFGLNIAAIQYHKISLPAEVILTNVFSSFDLLLSINLYCQMSFYFQLLPRSLSLPFGEIPDSVSF